MNRMLDKEANPRRAAEGVMDLAMPQVSAQVLHAFHEYPTQDTTHCFLLVDVYYRHLEYERSAIPKLTPDMKNEDIIKLASKVKPKILGPVLKALEEDVGENGEEFAWFTIGFENAWRGCTRDFLKRN